MLQEVVRLFKWDLIQFRSVAWQSRRTSVPRSLLVDHLSVNSNCIISSEQIKACGWGGEAVAGIQLFNSRCSNRGRPDAMLCGGCVMYLFGCLRVWMFKGVAVVLF